MSKIPIECPVCGSSYELNTKTVEKIEKGSIRCYVCHNVIFEYDGCTVYYPFLIQKKENHRDSGVAANGMS